MDLEKPKLTVWIEGRFKTKLTRARRVFRQQLIDVARHGGFEMWRQAAIYYRYEVVIEGKDFMMRPLPPE